MKKVFSSLILAITFPVKLLKKTKIDNFVGGLVFGAIFSLVVNIATVQIQEVIQKQRVLEAIENEIVSNLVRANSTYDARVKDINEITPINLYYSPTTYSADVWGQSSDAIGYVSQLDPEIQTKVILYYSSTVPHSNYIAQKSMNFINSAIQLCFTENLEYKTLDKIRCETQTLFAYTSDKFGAESISNEGFEVLQVFHPTKDRLNSWFLKLLMGNKSTVILSGK